MDKKLITIYTIPVSTNALYRGRRFLTQRGKENKETIALEAMTQWRQKPLDGRIRLKVSLFFPDARKRDIDNIKGLLDSFSGVLYTDDNQIDKLTITKEVDRDNPRVEIEVY